MWFPKQLLSFFEVSVSLKEEVAALRAQNLTLERELQSSKLNLDWLKIQYNQVQLERTALMDKVYGIKLPTPQLSTATPQTRLPSIEEFDFNDMGDDKARELGLPIYGFPTS